MRDTDWLSTEQVARELGMSSRWVRTMLDKGLVRGRVFLTGRRPTYRIQRRDLDLFVRRYVRDALDRDSAG